MEQSKVDDKRGQRGRFISGQSRSKRFNSEVRTIGTLNHYLPALTCHSSGAEIEIDDTTTTDDSWKDGRRIVELAEVAKTCFVVYRSPLHLTDSIGERRNGLGSILFIKCPVRQWCSHRKAWFTWWVSREWQDCLVWVHIHVRWSCEVNWLFNVTINDISVIHVTAHRCAGGLKK